MTETKMRRVMKLNRRSMRVMIRLNISRRRVFMTLNKEKRVMMRLNLRKQVPRYLPRMT